MTVNFYLETMKKLPVDLYFRVENLARNVLTDFKNKGYVIPHREPDGTVRFDLYTVVKESTGFYSVKDTQDRVYASGINLPQTAAVVANDLALGKIIDNRLLEIDRNYGYKIFDRDLFKRNCQNKKTTLDQMVYYKTQMETATKKANYYKSLIDRSFSKLSHIA